ncbi:hypothetical protein [Absidia glauca]|uniref:Sulfotransferase domain-containing protein n=1 Tax=Absidia glauca TaxID=4829 RepID=A0A168MFN5_ABSGL|nr:hypothetical protein [Absidia glauca]
MPLEIIGAGYGRTATLSLCIALEKLGVLARSPDLDVGVWQRAFDNPETHEDEWEKVYGNYRAAIDWPTCEFYKGNGILQDERGLKCKLFNAPFFLELSERYPDAKVILTTRSAESWAESFTTTIQRALDYDADDLSPRRIEIRDLNRRLMLGGALEREPVKKYDNKYLCEVFNNRVEEVKRIIPADRLLVLEMGDGWEPLCQFLGKEVPDEPYPHTNAKEKFFEMYPCPSSDNLTTI